MIIEGSREGDFWENGKQHSNFIKYIFIPWRALVLQVPFLDCQPNQLGQAYVVFV